MSNSADDNVTTLTELKRQMADFVAERNWNQFHTPKNLAMSISIEAAELMEHFQWLTGEESRSVRQDAAKMQAIGEELADVLCYALSLANELQIDVTQAMLQKLVKNRQKYPVDQYRGRYGKDDPKRAEE